jgi:hypothetical protein
VRAAVAADDRVYVCKLLNIIRRAYRH